VALIRPSAINRVTETLTQWENATRLRLPDQPEEIKSSALDDEGRQSFVESVLLPEANGICYFAVAASITQTVIDWGKTLRDHWIENMDKAIAVAKEDGRNRFANEMTSTRGWLRSTSGAMMIKMSILNAAIARSLRQATGTSFALGFDDELGELRYFIDRGFIRSAPDFWKDVLRSSLMHATQIEPIVVVDTWDDTHPFMSTFVERTVEDFIQLTPEFRNRFEFYDSRDSIPIRIADIIAGLLRRRFINDDSSPYLIDMKRRATPPERTILKFEDLRNRSESGQTIVNIYEEVARIESQRGN